MPSSRSCSRCSRPLEVESPSELCPTCQSALNTPQSTDPSSASPPPLADKTATYLDDQTATAVPGRTGGDADAAETAGPTRRRPRLEFPPSPLGYELVQVLGGGMGVVYLAHELATEREVAMKFLRGAANPSALERFLVEMRVLAELKHPNIVKVLSHDIYRADPFFTMEYQPGGTLGDLVAKNGPLAPAEAAKLIRVVAEAISAAHARGIVHRDLKPSNILLDENGVPKVSDFGLAKRTDRDDGITQGTGALGTPSYMPPEQLTNRGGEVTCVADIYGLGATLYYLLTKKPPFRGSTDVETMRLVETEPPSRPRAIRTEIPLALEAIVMKCLEKKPADRYQTADAFIASLDKFLAGKVDRETPQLTHWRRAKLWLGRNRRGVVAGTVATLLLTIAVLLGVAYWPKREKPQDPVDAFWKDVAAGRTGLLIGPDGPRLPVEWVFRPADMVAPPSNDAPFAIRTRDSSACVLVRNPPIERFRVRVGLRQDLAVREVVPKKPMKPKVGLVLGHAAVDAGNGIIVHALATLEYTELDLQKLKLKLAQDEWLRYRDQLVLDVPLLPLRGSTRDGPAILLDPPTPDEPHPWREIEADVGPDGVTFRCGGREKTVAIADIHRHWELHEADALERGVPIAPFQFPSWTPRTAAIGLIFQGDHASVKYLTIERLPQLP